MEVFNLPIANSSLNFSTSSIFTPKFSIRTCNKSNPYRFHVPSSKFNQNPSFSHYVTLSNTKKLQISARFGRPTIRRNSLRKKLIDDPQVRQKNSISSNPSTDFQNPNRSFDYMENFRENSSYDSVKGSDSNSGVFEDDYVVEFSSVKESESKRLGESLLSNELENWVDQYQKDADYWGIGSGPIFTVLQDSDGNVEQVSVDEVEILRRSRVDRREFEDSKEVNSKTLHAKHLAREMESGKNVIPRNSSVAKFVVSGRESGFVNVIRGVIPRPEFIPKIRKSGSMVLLVIIVFWVVKKLLTLPNKEVQHTEFEKEMMRRKIKSRKKREMLEKGSVEVVKKSLEPPVVFFEKPTLDKQELMNSILKAKASKDKLALLDTPSSQTTKSVDFDDKIQEIREMARQAQEFEGREQSQVARDEEEKQAVNEKSSKEMEMVKELRVVHPNRDSGKGRGVDQTIVTTSANKPTSGDTGFLSGVAFGENGVLQASSTPSVEVSSTRDLKDSEDTLHLTPAREVNQSSAPSSKTCISKKISIKRKPKIIRSVKEAREFLTKKGGKKELDQDAHVKPSQESGTVSRLANDKGLRSNTSQRLDMDEKLFETSILGETSDSMPPMDACEVPNLKDTGSVPTNKRDFKDSEEGHEAGDLLKPNLFLNDKINDSSIETGPSLKMENWLENNFHEVEPIVQSIGVGFRDNYKVARETVNQQLGTNTDMAQLGLNEDDSEVEWMKDDSLREIVFQVRENELAGRDPFYLMDAEDKLAFFGGLEKKVEKENAKLLHLHEYLHSNIENLDYGADGISLYDPPEKIIPHWKGPPLERNPEFLNNFLEQRKSFIGGDVKKDEPNISEKSTKSHGDENVATSTDYALERRLHDRDPKDSKTIIEGSDGSVRSGKKSGKEYWQHTKKWSREFLESYNAETDPEVKSIMKDLGKDLDRWITEKEIQEAADLMTELPERNKKFMEKKLNKLKREMELFGPQAVVSKYREYAEEKEDDYLWWLDLPHVLCIELYTIENGEQKIGFYSLEMASDLELEPKPFHVIAFEDAGDCKNLCYIIQAHMDMLGSGNAYVVPQPPKDAFREAKANGFGVTVIRKGELQLNADQTLEEAEEQISEIGSKIYHDQITRERSVDISSLMKGVFGVNGKAIKRRRSKRMLKKPRKK